MTKVHLFGIRHHGPGSARRLVEALDALRPAVVLIEGPSDASSLLPMLADPAMVPPIALLSYAADEPARAIFWPFAVYSPEYQAACWAVRNDIACRFIDLPAAWRLAPPDAAPNAIEHETDWERARLEHDPIGILAEIGGYTDGESWWHDVIEESREAGPTFAAVADAMAALREAAAPPRGREAAREAHMRLEIAAAAKQTEGEVAVVCGAWHEPALRLTVPASSDRALLKDAPRQKVATTWAPWTSARLASGGGYGAGVVAPGWCEHLWYAQPADRIPRWLARIAAALRQGEHMVSTAALIEAQRLSGALAALRGRPAAGFEELREAAIACLCFGETLLWDTVAPGLLLGSGVGTVPADVPLAPLIEDLQREQKRLRLTPEALDRELSLDLRSESGLERSTLLHRLTILGIPWGQSTDAGRSRGTFRERWVLRWEPEFAVRLVECLVYGSTIATAARGWLDAEFAKAPNLSALCALTLSALTAQLPEAAAAGLGRVEQRAARASDCNELLAALPPLGDMARYGQARSLDAERLGGLFSRILTQACFALPYAVRGLDTEAAAAMRARLLATDAAVTLIELPDIERGHWRAALQAIASDPLATALLAGSATRLLHDDGTINSDAAAILLQRRLSPGSEVPDAAAFFEGFFDGAGERLIHDNGLRSAVDAWLNGLDGEQFITFLPLFRRAFGSLDRMQRRRLLDALLGRTAPALAGRVLAPDAEAIWPAHFERIIGIVHARSADG